MLPVTMFDHCPLTGRHFVACRRDSGYDVVYSMIVNASAVHLVGGRLRAADIDRGHEG